MEKRRGEDGIGCDLMSLGVALKAETAQFQARRELAMALLSRSRAPMAPGTRSAMNWAEHRGIPGRLAHAESSQLEQQPAQGALSALARILAAVEVRVVDVASS